MQGRGSLIRESCNSRLVLTQPTDQAIIFKPKGNLRNRDYSLTVSDLVKDEKHPLAKASTAHGEIHKLLFLLIFSGFSPLKIRNLLIYMDFLFLALHVETSSRVS